MKRISFPSPQLPNDNRSSPTISALVFEATDPVAKLLVVHGLQSNAEWFRDSGVFLSERGTTVLAFDRRGSGKSEGLAGDAYTEADFLADIDTAYSKLKEIGPLSLPVHIHANCFGARIALPYIQQHPEAFRSLILTSPSTDMAKRADYSLWVKIFRVLNPFVPSTRYLDTPLKDSYFITKPKEALEWVSNDQKSLSLRRVTKRFLLSANTLTKRMNKAFSAINLPFCVILADKDLVVENEAIKRRLRLTRRGRYEMIELESEHLMERGPNQNIYREHMAAWLKRHS